MFLNLWSVVVPAITICVCHLQQFNIPSFFFFKNISLTFSSLFYSAKLMYVEAGGEGSGTGGGGMVSLVGFR